MGFKSENVKNCCIPILIHCCKHIGQFTPNDECILNQMDAADIMKIMFDAKWSCKKAKRHARSPLLPQAGHSTITTTKQHLSGIINGSIPVLPVSCANAILQAQEWKACYLCQAKSWFHLVLHVLILMHRSFSHLCSWHLHGTVSWLTGNHKNSAY